MRVISIYIGILNFTKFNKKQTYYRQTVFCVQIHKVIWKYIGETRIHHCINKNQWTMNIIARACYVILTDCTMRYALRFITFCNSEKRLRKQNNNDIQLVRGERWDPVKISSTEYYCIAFVYSARATVFYNGDPLISEAKLSGFDYLPRHDSGSKARRAPSFNGPFIFTHMHDISWSLLTIGDQSDWTILQFWLSGSI